MNPNRIMQPIQIASRTAALALLTALGCSADAVSEPEDPRQCEPVDAAAPEPLRWRRYSLLLGELGRALSLSRPELCTELGDVPCADVHQVALGGNNPFEQTMYEPIPNPLPLTPSVIDRVVLNACVNRVTADMAGDAVVFDALDLSAARLDPEDAAVREQVAALFRRLHGRDPVDAEVDVVAQLARESTGRDFAVLACFTIASTTEMVLI